MTTPIETEQRERVVADLKAKALKAGADIVGFEINPVHESEKPPGLVTELFNVWAECRNRDGSTDVSRYASGMLREDADYVFAARPDVVLSLVAALEEAEARAKAEYANGWRDGRNSTTDGDTQQQENERLREDLGWAADALDEAYARTGHADDLAASHVTRDNAALQAPQSQGGEDHVG